MNGDRGRNPSGSAVPAPDLSVIVVTWNTRELTLECLRRVHETRGDLDMEVVVVDNASADGTAAVIRERYPDVVVVENETNDGFPRANNQALALSRGRHVLFLNSDAFVDAGTLERCVRALDEDPSLGLVGCRLEYPDGRIQYECARRDYRLGHMAAEFLYLHQLFPRHRLFAAHLMGDWDHRDDRDVESVSGAFMMARREAVLEVGGLPEDLFMYHEDGAFCMRVRRAGWRIRYLADVRAVHLSNQSARRSPARLFMLEPEALMLLIRERQGPVAAGAARALFGVRALLRLAIAAPASLLPLRRLKARYPRLFHPERHALYVLWSLSPRLVRRLIPTTGGHPGAALIALIVLAGLAALASGCGDTTDPFGSDEIPVFTDVAVGPDHSCGVTEGRVFCWGSDLFAQASGANVGAGGPVFAQVSLPGAAEAVTAGQRHTCALMTSGEVLCWGWNHLGQLGNGELAGVRAPQRVLGEHEFSSIDAGWNHTCGIAGERTLCWGAGAQGRVGDGALEDRAEPVEVAGDTAFVQVTAGGQHTCGLAADGVAYCWGLGHAGQLGTGVAESSPVPVQVAGNDRFASLAAGFHHTCGVLVGGGLKCWGSNVFGELGNGALEAPGLPGSLVPGPVGFADGMVRVEAGAHFTCSSLSGGDTACWGRGVEGQLGAGMAYSHSWPQRIAGVAGPNRGGGFLPISRLALGVQHTCGLSTSGAIYCWGTGPHGELGSRRITYTNVPTRVYGR